jgi:co-chaperonin GroES (HSP10)
MKFRPLHDRVVIKRIEADEKTSGEIIIPDTTKENPRKGRSLPSARVVAMRAASSSRSMSRSGTGCCSASGQGPRSSSTASSTSS